MSHANSGAHGGEPARGPADAPEIHPAPSARQRLLLALAVMVFVLWIGYLGLLAGTTKGGVILSRPQLLVSNHVVIARLSGKDHPEAKATVEEDVWSGEPAAKRQAGTSLVVVDLPGLGPTQGWEGPGLYILALTQQKDGTLRVTPTPPSPGYPGDRGHIYPADAKTRQQLQAIERQYQRE
jgi:hypothetical protein